MNRPSSRRLHSYRAGLFGGRGGFLAALLALAVCAAAALRFLAPGALTAAVAPLWRAGASLTAAVGMHAPTESRASLRARADELAADNASLTAKNAVLAAQAADLTRLLGTRTEPEKGIVAGVVARPPVAPYDVLIIDQGARAGIREGALVSGPGGTPVGLVGDAGNVQSRVTLFSTRGIETAGWVGGNRIPLTLTGAGAGAFTAAIPRDAGAQVGDGVYVAAGGAYPVGTVVKVESDPSSPSVSLIVRPYTNPFSLTWVTVAP